MSVQDGPSLAPGGKGLGVLRRAHWCILLIEDEAKKVGVLVAGEDDFFVGKYIDRSGILRGQKRGDDGILETALRVLIVQCFDENLA